MPYAPLRLPVACALIGALSLSVSAQDWPHWRGPNYNGSVAAAALPKTFGPEENVRWAAAMPGPGASTPIVIGDRIFLSSVDAERSRLVALCLDRRVWGGERGVHQQCREKKPPHDALPFGGSRPITASSLRGRVVFRSSFALP